MTSNSFLFFLGSLIVGCLVALVLSYEEFKPYSEPLAIIISVSSFLMTIWSFLRDKQD